MNPYSVIALCSLGISILTFVAMLMGQRHTASVDYVTELEGKVKDLRIELDACKLEVKALQTHNGGLMKENIELLRRLAHMNGT